MKILYIEARKKFDKIDLDELNNLPGRTISLAGTVQYLDLIPKVKAYLEKKSKKVLIRQGSSYSGQVLGCKADAFDSKADSLLLLADGKFHAMNNALLLNREIYVFNGELLEKLSKQDIEQKKAQIKGKINKFLTYTNIGILVSMKQGQYYNIGELKKKLAKKGKNAYIFEADTINMGELENFPDIQIWINTACPGLAIDNNRLVNLRDIENLL